LSFESNAGISILNPDLWVSNFSKIYSYILYFGWVLHFERISLWRESLPFESSALSNSRSGWSCCFPRGTLLEDGLALSLCTGYELNFLLCNLLLSLEMINFDLFSLLLQELPLMHSFLIHAHFLLGQLDWLYLFLNITHGSILQPLISCICYEILN
jgi:hypothetical protein